MTGQAAQMTYADLAKGTMPLPRIDAVCCMLKLDFAGLARRVADMQLLLAEMHDMSEAQDRAVVADKKLLL